MGIGSTREEILEVAFDLFSVNGYEATSISQIADAVGIRKASLYSHFGSKQDILDTVIESVIRGYEENSLFASADWDDPGFIKDKKGMKADAAAKMIQEHVSFILHDPVISRGRKMLTIEQFRSDELAELYTRMNYDDIMRFFEGMISFLIRSKVLTKADIGVMAAQLALPVAACISLCDREPRREKEAMELIRKHVLQFFKVYGRQK